MPTNSNQAELSHSPAHLAPTHPAAPNASVATTFKLCISMQSFQRAVGKGAYCKGIFSAPTLACTCHARKCGFIVYPIIGLNQDGMN